MPCRPRGRRPLSATGPTNPAEAGPPSQLSTRAEPQRARHRAEAGTVGTSRVHGIQDRTVAVWRRESSTIGLGAVPSVSPSTTSSWRSRPAEPHGSSSCGAAPRGAGRPGCSCGAWPDRRSGTAAIVVVDVTGTARSVTATRELSDPNPDLWWAHTGGGGGRSASLIVSLATALWSPRPRLAKQHTPQPRSTEHP
jgi:hypothetical protein